MNVIDEIYNENCLDTMKRMPDGVIDLTVTSPPYDDMREYKGYTFNFEPIAKELFRVTKQGGVVVWVVSDKTQNGSESGTSLKQALFLKECGFNLHDTMIYEKNTAAFPATFDDVRYTQIFEYMFVFSKGKPKTINLLRDKTNKYRGQKTWGEARKRNTDGSYKDTSLTNQKTKDLGIRNNIWRYICSGQFGQSHSSAYEHPATFPEKLAEDHILSWSNENDLVFDPMAGSGTTLLMARKHKRHYLGCEISSEYFDLIQKRMKRFKLIYTDKNPFFDCGNNLMPVVIEDVDDKIEFFG
jgi:site-specific DNA-methyltransferase (adenine-specific)